jgi:hypothetical protein
MAVSLASADIGRQEQRLTTGTQKSLEGICHGSSPGCELLMIGSLAR